MSSSYIICLLISLILQYACLIVAYPLHGIDEGAYGVGSFGHAGYPYGHVLEDELLARAVIAHER